MLKILYILCLLKHKTQLFFYGFVGRRDSREMPPLEAFVRRELLGFEISPEDFAEGGWIDRVPELLSLPRRPREASGADHVANVVSAFLVGDL